MTFKQYDAQSAPSRSISMRQAGYAGTNYGNISVEHKPARSISVLAHQTEGCAPIDLLTIAFVQHHPATPYLTNRNQRAEN
jgi:hypothetical protein